MFVPSKYQKAVYTYITKCKGNAVVDAVAGSGKSTTIVNALKIIPTDKSVLFLAFNKSIVEELKKKIGNLPNVEISTLHSLGARACMKKCRCKINSGKYSQYITKRLEDGTIQGEMYDKLSAPDKITWRNNIYNLFDLARVNLCNDNKSITELSYKHDIDIIDNEVEVVLQLMSWGKNNVSEIDFTDMIYFPNVMNIPLVKYDWVFIDECQDLNAAQRELFLKCIKPGGRFIAVGDERQCQPGYSMVKLPGGIEKPISEIREGERVISYDKRGGKFLFCNGVPNLSGDKTRGLVQKVAKRRFDGNLICVKSDNYSSEYTPNHRCMIKFREDNYHNSYFVYLMCRYTQFGVDWRIGKSKLFENHVGSFGPRVRLRNEKGDAIWLLRLCKNDSEAKIWEEIYATRYGVTQKCFTCGGNNNKTFGNEKNLKMMFTLVNRYVEKRIDFLFKDMNLDIDYPFLTKNDKRNHYSKLHMFECFAVNLPILKNCVQVLEYNNGERKWSNIQCERKEYHGYVYSLKVGGELYISDNILTHNCIYGFAGADHESFNKLRKQPNTVKLPLSICYRCDKDIITLSKTIVPQIQSRDNAENGIINRESKIEDVKDGDMILCRITAPLIRLCMKYISKGIKAYVKGRDIGSNLCSMIDRTGEETIEGALNAMRRELGKIIGKLIAQKIVSNEEEAKEHPRYVNMNDKIESIESISEGLTKSSDVIEKIKTIFSDDNGSGICLSTIHKSKGLENDRVFIICENKMPLKGCMNIPWMAEQEWNLIYVAYTRAKHYLGFIQDFE